VRPVPKVTDLDLRQGVNGVKSPDETKADLEVQADAIASSYVRLLGVIEEKDRTISDLRAKLDATEKKLSNLELKTRGVAWRKE
jgi:hypothetical protein